MTTQTATTVQLEGRKLIEVIAQEVETMVGTWMPVPQIESSDIDLLRNYIVDDSTIERVAIAIAKLDAEDQTHTIGDVLDRMAVTGIVTPCGCVTADLVPFALVSGLAGEQHGIKQTGEELAQRLNELAERATFDNID